MEVYASLIKAKDVIRIKVPYPDLDSKLAKVSHMYICKENQCDTYACIKCQTYRPNIVAQKTVTHYYIEEADIKRNPFTHKTLIDCDKLFYIRQITLCDELKTQRRPDICDELFTEINNELNKEGFHDILLDSNKLVQLNQYIIK